VLHCATKLEGEPKQSKSITMLLEDCERGVLFRREDLSALSFSSLFFVLDGSSSSRCIELDDSSFAEGVCVDDAGAV
jgi:hypothetical protein